MKDNKHKIFELFLYILIVIAGLALLVMEKEKKTEVPATTTPPAHISMQNEERWNENATIPDWKG